jgi:hypothetical protein
MSIGSKRFASLCISKSQRWMSPEFEEAKLRNALSGNFGLIRPLVMKIQTFANVSCPSHQRPRRRGLESGTTEPGQIPRANDVKKETIHPAFIPVRAGIRSECAYVWQGHHHAEQLQISCKDIVGRHSGKQSFGSYSIFINRRLRGTPRRARAQNRRRLQKLWLSEALCRTTESDRGTGRFLK